MNDFSKINLRINSEDPEVFRQQMEESAEIYWEYSQLLESAKSHVSKLKMELKVKEATIANELRNRESKISEARIERSLYDFPDYIEVMNSYNDAKTLEGKLSALVKSLDIRHGLILSIAGMKKREARII